MTLLKLALLYSLLMGNAVEVKAETYEDGSFVIIGCRKGAMCENDTPHRTYITHTHKITLERLTP